jgi:hypothetical protein
VSLLDHLHPGVTASVTDTVRALLDHPAVVPALAAGPDLPREPPGRPGPHSAGVLPDTSEEAVLAAHRGATHLAGAVVAAAGVLRTAVARCIGGRPGMTP